MNERIEFELNGKTVSLEVDSSRSLLWVLRHDLSLTGSKYGCGEGYCGACTVVLDGRAVRSCRLPMKAVAGKTVLTIEGLAPDGALHPIQKAFAEEDALQCGYCTPGMILSAYSLLRRKPKPTRAEIIQGMEGNLCRCGAHTRIIRAIESAAAELERSGSHE